MNNALSIGLSGLLTLERRLETVAHNVANINTVGYRAETVRFGTQVERAGRAALAFAERGGEHISTRAGARIQTGNPLDVAIKGDGYLSMQGPGGPVYARDGRMEMSPEGELRSITGMAVLDAGGAPISLNPRGGPVSITPDGALVQDGRRTGVLGFFRLPDTTLMRRAGDVAFTYAGAAEPVTDMRNDGFVQGFVEQANVSGVEQMSALISASRMFEAAANALRANEDNLQAAIRALGGAQG